MDIITQLDTGSKAPRAYCGGARCHQPHTRSFSDGNKRTAHVCYRVFLALNGVELNASAEDKYVAMLSLAEGSVSELEFADWLRKHITPPADAVNEPKAAYR